MIMQSWDSLIKGIYLRTNPCTNSRRRTNTPQINLSQIIPHFPVLNIIAFVSANNPFNSITIHMRTGTIKLTVGLNNVQKCALKPTFLAEIHAMAEA